MLNGALAFNGRTPLWASAPMLKHNSNAKRLMSAYLPKQPLLWFLTTNKRYILPPNRIESLTYDSCNYSSGMALPQHELFRWLTFGNGSLAFYRHLKRPTQHVVVC